MHQRLPMERLTSSVYLAALFLLITFITLSGTSDYGHKRNLMWGSPPPEPERGFNLLEFFQKPPIERRTIIFSGIAAQCRKIVGSEGESTANIPKNTLMHHHPIEADHREIMVSSK